MKNFFTLLFIFVMCSARAATYYFSSVSGDDSRTPTQANSASTPWKSLSKLNDFFISLQPGDSVLFNRGETFYGSITVNKSGINGSPIVISAYGTGSRPVITALTRLSNWVAVGNGIYESYNSSLGGNLNILLINDAAQPMGRYPNEGYLTLEARDGISITDNELSSTPNWTDAEVVLRTVHWVIERCKITSHSGNTIYYIPNDGAYRPRVNFGYFIQNSIKTLDQSGEWYYNSYTKKVSMYFGANSPSFFNITASAVEYLINSSSKSYIVFDNLTLKGANKNGFNINGGSNFSIKNCDILSSGEIGISASNAYLKVENCTVINSSTGIAAGSAPYAALRNNIVRNTYSTPGMGKSGEGQGFGIKIGKGGLAEYNQIINSGFAGISFSGDSSVVKDNYIDTFCFVKDDGGGIYASNGNNLTFKGIKVTGNIVLNGIGAPDGTDIKSSNADGIYMDDDLNGVEITGNTIANANRGLYLHNTRNIVVRNNTSFNNNSGQLQMKYDGLGEPLRNHIITNNIFFSKFARQTTSSIYTQVDDIDSIGRLDSNYYARPIDDRTSISNIINLYSSSEKRDYRDLAGWKAEYNKDPSSKKSPRQIVPFKVRSINGTNKVLYGAFSSSTDAGKPFANSCDITWENSGVLDIGYIKVIPSAENSSIVLGVGALDTAKKYILRYSLKGTGSMSISSYLRSSDYKPISSVQYRTVSTTRSENEMLFTPSANQTGCSLVFTVDAQSTYYLDNIQLYEADATDINPDDSIKFVINPGPVSKSISLDGNYVDVKNNKFSNSIILQPYASAVLIKDGGVQNISPIVSITTPATSAIFAANEAITISAVATDVDGTISKVDFYKNDTLIGTAAASPYTITWNNHVAGNYTITAKATDNGSLVAASGAVAISLYTPNVPPSVSLTSPISNAKYIGPTTITMTADAADADGTIRKVQFYNGITLLKTVYTAPYTYLWTDVPAGKYTITAKATDNEDSATTSASVTVVVVRNIAPSVSLTSPVSTAKYIGPTTITMSADAADADGTIRKVQFYNGITLLKTVYTAPYTYSWTDVPAGNYTITAKATDDKDTATTSASVTVVVLPNVPPSVSLTSPVSTAKYIGPTTITMAAAAADADGTISKVQFYNGITLLKTVYTAPYTYSWTSVPAGNYTITAKATDDKGSATTSVAVAVTVLQNVAPVVTITSPLTNSSYNGLAKINMSASATDIDGTISKVNFYNGTTLLKTVYTAPYTYSWIDVPAGKYTITAKATDNKGAITTSDSVVVSVLQISLALRSSTVTPSSFSADTSKTLVPMQMNLLNMQSEQVSIKLAPNPASNTVYVSGKGLPQNKEFTISVISMNGTVLKTIHANTSDKAVEINISSLSSGVYTIKAAAGYIILIKQFVKL